MVCADIFNYDPAIHALEIKPIRCRKACDEVRLEHTVAQTNIVI
jgi:hypothetical protein